jgi:hypothetical protein
VYTVFLNFKDEVPEKPQEEVLINLRIKYNESKREKEMAKVGGITVWSTSASSTTNRNGKRKWLR